MYNFNLFKALCETFGRSSLGFVVSVSLENKNIQTNNNCAISVRVSLVKLAKLSENQG